jgi:hypothetical protein
MRSARSTGCALALGGDAVAQLADPAAAACSAAAAGSSWALASATPAA